MKNPVFYHLTVTRPERRLLGVEVRLGSPPTELSLVLPSWTPGSYLMREYARHVVWARAETVSGRALEVHKTAKGTWKVEGHESGDTVLFRYELYAHELSVRANMVDTDGGFVEGAATWVAVDGEADRPAILTVAAPAGWRIDCALPRDGDGWRAPDYRALIDAPLLLGRHRRIDRAVRGVPVRLAVFGDAAEARLATLADDAVAIVDEAAALFGELPYERYLFLLSLLPGRRGGLEHRDSTALHYPPAALDEAQGYEDLVELLAHEHFHVWLGKRIVPAALWNPDLTREAYCRELWLVEGVTSYYDRLLCVRAGRLGTERYLDKIVADWNRLLAGSGRRRQSMAEAGFDAWIKFYRPTANSPDATVSYYLKGALVALVLDLTLRRLSGDQVSLDTVMQRLWVEFGRPGRPLPAGAFEAICDDVAGESLGAFFDCLVRGTEDPDLVGALADVGVELVPRGPVAWLGLAVASVADGVQVVRVAAGSPAELAGLAPGDIVRTVDGTAIDAAGWHARVDALGVDEALDLEFARRGSARPSTVVSVAHPSPGWELGAITPTQRRSAWLASLRHDRAAKEQSARG